MIWELSTGLNSTDFNCSGQSADNASLRNQLQMKLFRSKAKASQMSEGVGITESGLTHLSSNRMNDKVDTKFSQMHSKFVLLKEKENKLNFEIKKEEILKQKSRNLPGHIIEKYSNAGPKGSQVQTTGGTKRNHFGSISGRKHSEMTSSPDKGDFQSKLLSKLRMKDPRKYAQMSLDKTGPKMEWKRESREMQENSDYNGETRENCVDARKKETGKGSEKDSNEVVGQTPRKQTRPNKAGGTMGKNSEELKNLSVVKIHNRFNKMISEFDNIDVNRSYLENGFQNMKSQFGGISDPRLEGRAKGGREGLGVTEEGLQAQKSRTSNKTHHGHPKKAKKVNKYKILDFAKM